MQRRKDEHRFLCKSGNVEQESKAEKDPLRTRLPLQLEVEIMWLSTRPDRLEPSGLSGLRLSAGTIVPNATEPRALKVSSNARIFLNLRWHRKAAAVPCVGRVIMSVGQTRSCRKAHLRSACGRACIPKVDENV